VRTAAKIFHNPPTESVALPVFLQNKEATMTRNPTTFRARELRQQANPAEQALWAVLKSRQLGGFKFTRQLPIGPYFADFVCRARGVVIEVDGSQHQDQLGYDRARDEYMLRAGYAVFRVPTATVVNNRQGVCDSILAALEDRLHDDEGPDLRYRQSFATPIPRGFTSHTTPHHPISNPSPKIGEG
jgi:very-short-patch-repair endonuclease